MSVKSVARCRIAMFSFQICVIGENEVISKVLDKISTDYEQLKKNYEALKCPKDDKILALRKTARALETENELLHEEKMMIEKETKRIRKQNH